jgi:acyl-CoA synthetase (NDP forming)
MTGSDAAIEAAEQCAELGVPVVTLIADGFLSTDADGMHRRRRLQAALSNSPTRLLGPSSLGVATIAAGMMLTANAAFADPGLQAGGIFVASQSGSAIGALATRGSEMGVGFRALVSTGNELDLSVGQICRAAVDDPEVSSFALFLENIAHAGDLRDFALAAAEKHKPVVAYKLGRSQAGARLAVSHTGALAGDDAVADALLADLGIARVGVFEALLEAQNLAGATGWRQSASRPRVCVVSTTGGGGAMVVDCLAQAGAEPSGPRPDTIARLADLGVRTNGEALIDLTLAGTQYDIMHGALKILLAAPEFDAVVAVPGSSARYHPDLAVQPIADCAHSGKPLAAFVVPAAGEALALLQKAGVSAFRTPEACADAVVALSRRRRPLPRRRTAPMPAGSVELVDEAESYSVLQQASIAVAPHAVVAVDHLPDELPVSGPVAVKLLSPQVAHKSDLGAVVLGVADGAGLAAAVMEIVDNVAERAPHVAVQRVLVQTMVADGRGEALVGLRRDPDAGPVVVLAAGGVLAELYRDRVVRTAPVDMATAREMIDHITAFKPLAGYRNAPAGDLEALARAVVAISELADTAPDIVEAEVNPLFVGSPGQGVVAVDALIRRATAVGR